MAALGKVLRHHLVKEGPESVSLARVLKANDGSSCPRGICSQINTPTRLISSRESACCSLTYPLAQLGIARGWTT